jgi:hypothetical protein
LASYTCHGLVECSRFHVAPPDVAIGDGARSVVRDEEAVLDRAGIFQILLLPLLVALPALHAFLYHDPLTLDRFEPDRSSCSGVGVR